jgi:hypothetical protein
LAAQQAVGNHNVYLGTRGAHRIKLIKLN